MSKKKIAASLIIGCIFLVSVFSSNLVEAVNPATDPEPHSDNIVDWTVMYYLCCDNHVSYEAKKIVDNLTKVGSTDDFNLIVLSDAGQVGDSALSYIEEGNVRNLNVQYGWPDELDMGNPNTIKSFVNLVMKEYPAQHYALIILSDAGSGWQGICRDTKHRNQGFPLMSMPTFADVLKDVTNDGANKIDVIGFKPCVTGMFEVAYEIAPYAEYMVASEEHQLEELDKGPEYTWRYLPSTWNLKNNTNMTSELFAKSIVDYYKTCDFPLWVLYYRMVFKDKGQSSRFIRFLSQRLTKIVNNLRNPSFHVVSLHTTLSAINLSRTAALSDAVDNLASILLLNRDNMEVVEAIDNARYNVREYGKAYPKNSAVGFFYLNFPLERFAFNSFVDLYDLVQLINNSVANQFVKDVCSQVMEKLEDAVIANKAMSDDESHGLSIYLPINKKYYNKYIWNKEAPVMYEELQFSQDTLWDEFLREYLNI